MQELKPTLAKALLFIHRHRVEKGYMPNTREVGISLGSVHRHRNSGANYGHEIVTQLRGAGALKPSDGEVARGMARAMAIDYESRVVWDTLYRWECARTGTIPYRDCAHDRIREGAYRRQVLICLAELPDGAGVRSTTGFLLEGGA